MNLDINNSDLLNEIFMFKNNKLNELDPIKKDIFSFSEILYIMNNIVPFPVNIEDYYYYKFEDLSGMQFMLILALNYITCKIFSEKNLKFKKIYINEEDLIYTINFIEKFFEYDIPIEDSNNSIVWIYPKYSIREFLTDCILLDDYNRFYIDDETLTKFIMIMAGFSRYEFNNLNENIIKSGLDINYPTLILANIKLYEKGIIKLIDSSDGVGLFLDFSNKSQHKVIFTNNTNKLKEKIIQVLNRYENLNYSLSDFLD